MLKGEGEMIAKVEEIQVCGRRLFTNLEEACKDYLQCLEGGIDREKLHFTIILPTGKVKSITIRQEDEQVVAYGDFEGLPNALDYAKEVWGNEVESPSGEGC